MIYYHKSDVKDRTIFVKNTLNHYKPYPFKRMTEKWGDYIGIFLKTRQVNMLTANTFVFLLRRRKKLVEFTCQEKNGLVGRDFI